MKIKENVASTRPKLISLHNVSIRINRQLSMKQKQALLCQNQANESNNL